MKDNTGLGLGYRIGWRLEYIGVSCFGPAQHVPSSDPKRRLRRERAARVIAAHEARGTQAPEWVHEIVTSGGDAPRKKRARQAAAQPVAAAPAPAASAEPAQPVAAVADEAR